MDVITIISLVIGLLGLIAGGVYWTKFKDIIQQVKVIIDLILDAVEDDDITRQELDIIVKEAKALFELFKGGAAEGIKEKIQSIKSLKKHKKGNRK